jgi:hypothetical protein
MSDSIDFACLEKAYHDALDSSLSNGPPSYGIMTLGTARYIMKDPSLGGDLSDSTIIELFSQ